ncbi:tetratricopeptide repeat protein [bacterium AH-315-C07]|nr:tetratricopeptide repeat protein [bacterium AH-315-C07]
MRRILFVIMLIISVTCFAISDGESFRQDSNSEIRDTAKINMLVSLGEREFVRNPDTALVIWQKALELTVRSIGDGANYSKNVINRLKSKQAEVMINIGYYHMTHGAIDMALEQYYKGLKIQEKINDKFGIANTLNNIAEILASQVEIEKALEYFLKSLKILEELENFQFIAYSLSNVGITYVDLGNDEKALEYYFRSLEIHREQNNQEGIAITINSIAGIYEHQNDIDKALEYYLTSLKILEDLGYKQYISMSLSNIGMVYFNRGDNSTAYDYCIKALNVAQELGFTQSIKEAARKLCLVYREQNKWKEALQTYELQIQMTDSILNEENTKAMVRQQMKYEYEKEQLRKEHEVQEKARIDAEATTRRDHLHYTGIIIGLLILTTLIPFLGEVRGGSVRTLQVLIFITFLIFFEFLLVLLDPYIEEWTGGAPGYKLLFNAILAGLIFPLHQFFEGILKRKILKRKQSSLSNDL